MCLRFRFGLKNRYLEVTIDYSEGRAGLEILKKQQNEKRSVNITD